MFQVIYKKGKKTKIWEKKEGEIVGRDDGGGDVFRIERVTLAVMGSDGGQLRCSEQLR